MPKSRELIGSGESREQDNSTIEMPLDEKLYSRLVAKTEDYKARIAKEKRRYEKKGPEAVIRESADERYKLAILQAVLDGGADKIVIESQLQGEDGEFFSDEEFANAWRVIKAYATGKEEKVEQGTGLRPYKE